MTNNLNSSKTNVKKRSLRFESLENREMLSVNPLGYDGTVAVQTDQQFSTEAVAVANDIANITSITIGAQAANANKFAVNVALTSALSGDKTYNIWCWVDTSGSSKTPRVGAGKWIAGTGNDVEDVQWMSAGTFDIASGKSSEIYNLDLGNYVNGASGSKVWVVVALDNAGEPSKTGGAYKLANGRAAYEQLTAFVTGNPVVETGQTGSSGKIGYQFTTFATSHYLVQTSTNNSSWADVGSPKQTLSAAVSGTIEGLTPGVNYYVRVLLDREPISAGKTAIGAATNVNLGSFKTAQEGTASNITAPAVNKITASINNSGVLNIGWVAPANYTGTYTVGVEKWNGTAWGTVTGTVITPGKTAATLANQTAGYFRITVRAADGPVTATAPAAIFGIGTSSLDNFVGILAGNPPTGAAAAIRAALADTAKVANLKVKTVAIAASGTLAVTLDKPDSTEAASIAAYLVTITDSAGKGVVYQEYVTKASTEAGYTLPVVAAKLVAGTKYDVSVTALATTNSGATYTDGAAAKGSYTVPKFSDATISANKGEYIGEITFKIPNEKVNNAAGVKYFLEYTKVADAKGKPDWNNAMVIDVLKNTAPELTGLDSGTQYYARLVAVNGTSGSDATTVVLGKEVKFKTVAAPAVSISKSGYTLTPTQTGIKLSVQFTAKAFDQKNLISANDKKVGIQYELIVSADKTVDSSGKLSGGKTIIFQSGDLSFMLQNAVLEPGKSGATALKDMVFKVEADMDVILNTLSDKISADYAKDFKSLYVQLLVKYSDNATNNVIKDSPHVITTAYTKAATLALPKWFV